VLSMSSVHEEQLIARATLVAHASCEKGRATMKSKLGMIAEGVHRTKV